MVMLPFGIILDQFNADIGQPIVLIMIRLSHLIWGFFANKKVPDQL